MVVKALAKTGVGEDGRKGAGTGNDVQCSGIYSVSVQENYLGCDVCDDKGDGGVLP